MSFSVKPVDAYATDVMNRAGMLARVLEALTNAGADLEFVIARRVTQNTSRVFVAPLKGAKVLRAASDVGMQRAIKHVGKVGHRKGISVGRCRSRRLAPDAWYDCRFRQCRHGVHVQIAPVRKIW